MGDHHIDFVRNSNMRIPKSYVKILVTNRAVSPQRGRNPLQNLFNMVRRTHDPAAGSANELLVQLVRRGDRGFRFRSEKEARCHRNVDLLLNLQLTVWVETKPILGRKTGGIVRLSESAKHTLTRR